MERSEHIGEIMTPVMNHVKDKWLEDNIRKCMEDNCTIPTAADRLGISKETAAEWYTKIMIADSKRAVHDLYGNVRVYQWKSGHYFIFHEKEDEVLGRENPDFNDWKCPPIE